MTFFDREWRYFVIKLTDADASLTNQDFEQLTAISRKVEHYREEVGKSPLACVVVESDWPEYEAVWSAIEYRVTGSVPEGVDSFTLGLHNVINRLCQSVQALGQDSKRYQWLIEQGHLYSGAAIGTASMTPSKGPYIVLDLPSVNRFSSLVLSDKAATDAVIDKAISSAGWVGKMSQCETAPTAKFGVSFDPSISSPTPTRELLSNAAAAADVELFWHASIDACWLMSSIVNTVPTEWNPIVRNHDAFDLAVQLSIIHEERCEAATGRYGCSAAQYGYDFGTFVPYKNVGEDGAVALADKTAATRLAITQVAAAIGRKKLTEDTNNV